MVFAWHPTLRFEGAGALARIGGMADMGQADTSVFEAWGRQLERLEEEVLKLEPESVQTGGTWLRALGWGMTTGTGVGVEKYHIELTDAEAALLGNIDLRVR